MKTKHLLFSGFLIPIIFWATTILCGLILGNYNHFSGQVSELGAIGTKTQYLFSAGLILSSFFSILFVIGLYRTCIKVGLNSLSILLILTFSFSICGAALFPLPLKLHGLLGSPSVLLIFSPLISVFFWKSEKVPAIIIMALLTFLIMLVGFLTFMPNILSDYPGLKQRFFHLGWSVWFIYLSWIFNRINKTLD